MSRSATPVLPLHNVTSSSHLRPSTPRGPSRRSRHGASSSVTSFNAQLSPQETAEQLSTSLTHGISPSDAEVRLHRYGPNELPHEDPEPLWLRFLKQFKETLILLLLASAAISFIVGNLDDAISIAIAVTIVVTVGFVQEYRSEKSLEALNSLVPHFAHLIRAGTTRSTSAERSSQTGRTLTIPQSDGNLESSVASLVEAEKASITVPASKLVPGDLVLFSTGDRIPADIRITRAADLTIDESNLSGETEAVHKYADALENPLRSPAQESPASDLSRSHLYASPVAGTVGADIRLNDQKNIAFMGTLVRSGHGQGIVVATGANTEFGAIHASLQEIESPRTPLQLTMDRLGQELSYMSFGVIAVIVLLGLIQGRKWLDMFQVGVSLAVAAIPEGLPIIVTVTLALGVLRMSKRGAIVRRLPSVETLGSVNVVCSDKTGTLTMNHMTVTKMWHFDVPAPVEVQKEAVASSPSAVTRTILRIGNIANNALLSKTHSGATATASVLSSTLGQDPSDPNSRSRWVGQPTDVAILDLLDSFGEDDVRERLGSRSAETPFSSERKWMGVVIGGNQNTDSGRVSGLGVTETAYIKGALEQVLKRCDTYLTSEGREVVLDEPRRAAAMDAADKMAQEGLRVLGFASGPTQTAQGGLRAGSRTRSETPKPPADKEISRFKNEDAYRGLTFAGVLGMSDPPRKDVDKSIRRLISGGVHVIMITGDAEATAVAIARNLGMPINHSQSTGRSVISGDELDRMTEDELSQAIASTSIFARTSPDHKMKIIRALQARGDVVAMTGDGVNDAPALKKADIGVAMGRLGTDVAKEAADMILTDDDFSTILSAIEEGKGIFNNIQNFLTFQLSTSVAALSLVLLSTAFGLKNPLNPMQILWINILMDGPPAQSLGVEPVDPAVMNRPPRPKTARVLTKAVVRRVLTSATIIMMGTMLIYVYEMSGDGKVTARDTTMTFTCFVLFDMFNALTCRSEGKSILRGEIGLLSNKMFTGAVAGSLAGQLAVIYLPFLQKIFQTEALGFFDLVWLIIIASTVFWVDEGRKYYFAKSYRRLGGYSTNV